jgi:hypothetical protein
VSVAWQWTPFLVVPAAASPVRILNCPPPLILFPASRLPRSSMRKPPEFVLALPWNRFRSPYRLL